MSGSDRKNKAFASRSAGAFRARKDQRRYWIVLVGLIALGVCATLGLLVYNNPVPIDSPSFWPVARRRMVAVMAMLIAAFCQSIATVSFQTVTSNRIITPSLLGFEALYSAIHTSTVYFFGLGALLSFTGIGSFIFQVAAMVAMCLLLYGWLLSGKYGNLQLMLLVGIILGSGLRSISGFMRRLLTPSEFDILQARLFGSVNNADPEYFSVAIPIVLAAGGLLFCHAKKLNVIALGREVCTNLGVQHRRNVIYVLTLVSVLMAVSTALVGPLTFFGFLVATLTYQLCPSYDHRYLIPMALAIGFAVLTGSYFVMNHIFNAQGVVSIIIELVGGLVFLAVILKRGKL